MSNVWEAAICFILFYFKLAESRLTSLNISQVIVNFNNYWHPSNVDMFKAKPNLTFNLTEIQPFNFRAVFETVMKGG